MLNGGVETKYGFLERALGIDKVKEASQLVETLGSAKVPVTHHVSEKAFGWLIKAEAGAILRVVGIATVATATAIAVIR